MISIFSPKNKIKSIPLSELKSPYYVHISIGKNTEPIVKLGEYVSKYQPLVAVKHKFASIVHASISGTITEISDENITIKNDFKNTKYTFPEIDIASISRESFVNILLQYGIVGAGGAMFPSHIKYDIGDKKVKTFIINAAECEPYLTADYILLQDKFEEIAKTILLIGKIFEVENIVIGIEKTHKNIEKRLVQTLNSLNNNIPISIKWLPESYPQGGELQLIESITGIELARGVLPIEKGIIVNNIATIHSIYNAIFNRIPFVERIVTIAGENINNTGNYIIPIGTSLTQIKNQLFPNIQLQDFNIIAGGPMMGKIVTDENYSIKKGNGGLLFLQKHSTTDYNCIKCGDCITVCPMHLMPLNFVIDNYENNIESFQKDRITDCIECGACAYVCPSNVPLIESILSGKNKLKQLHG
jgi:Na+-translocating ferredoxin:NAD+ oxidoreductase subunit C